MPIKQCISDDKYVVRVKCMKAKHFLSIHDPRLGLESHGIESRLQVLSARITSPRFWLRVVARKLSYFAASLSLPNRLVMRHRSRVG